MTRRIVYLHGFASGPDSKKARFFQERFRAENLELEIPDLAEEGFERLTITGQLRVVERVASGRPVSLIGSSMGGYLAALYAARHPETEKLVLMAPAFGFARRWTETLDAGELEKWRRTGKLKLFHYAEQREREVGYELIEDGLLYEEYPEASQPVLIFHGANDDVVPLAYSAEFARSRPNVRLEVVASDHELLNMMDRMWEEAREFLGTD